MTVNGQTAYRKVEYFRQQLTVGNSSAALWTNITVAAGNPYYASTNGVLFDKALATLICYPQVLTGSYTVPSSVTSIGAT